MKIVQEKIDRENYLEICISKKEFSLLHEYLIISESFSVLGDVTHIGIKLELTEDFDD